MSNNIERKDVVIGGASSGMGEAAARHLSAQGAARDYVGQVGVPADSFARVVAFAISQPYEVDINEILFRPTSQEL